MNATHLFLGDPPGWKETGVHLSALQGLWGGWIVSVNGSLEAVVQRVSPITHVKRYQLAVTGEEFRSLLETCVEKDLLTVPYPTRPGHPDETMIQLTLVNPQGETQTVCKWAGDVQERFNAVSRRLFALTTLTKDMQPFSEGPFQWPPVKPATP